MKKLLYLFAFAAMTSMMVSCGESSRKAQISFGVLDDYFSADTYTLVTDAAEKGLENWTKASGSLTIVVKRNGEELPFSPSDLRDVDYVGETSHGKIVRENSSNNGNEAAVKNMLRMAPNSEARISFPVESSASDEEEFNDITKGILEEITFELEFKEDALERAEAAKALKLIQKGMSEISKD